MKTIAAVIPAFDINKLHGLLECIARNTMLPTRLILINNTQGDVIVPMKMPGTKIDIIDPPSPMSVNASWRKGFELGRECNLICIFRDDILISYDFFQKVRQASNKHPMASVYCPAVEKDPNKLNRFMFSEAQCSKMKGPEDLVFVLRSEFLRDLPMVPQELTTFFGTKWIWTWTSQIWMRSWVKVNNALAFLNNGPIVNAKNKELWKGEKKIFDTLVQEL